MPAGLVDMPGLAWIVAAACLAGIVRGFSGFGTAMVYLPVAGQWLTPFEALTTLAAMDLVGPLPNVPRALRDGDPPDVLRLAAGLVLALPAGLLTLSLVPAEAFRYAVSLLALGLLAVLAAGLRYHGPMSPRLVLGTGAAGGFLAGTAGMPGPPVILLYMASPLPVSAIRANTLLYLLLADMALLAAMTLGGVLEPGALWLGLVLILPYTLANIVGAALFRPDRARAYRTIAYGIIALSALNGLPLFD
ncbi:MAG: TSUP family transporter [Tranquillimonas sp.]